MILLDTNVISAVMAPAPPRAVLSWLDRQQTSDLYVSVITVAEIAYGIRILPEGKRRRNLATRFEGFLARGFEQRVLVFDTAAALKYAVIMAGRKQIGRPMSVPDGQIAAIALQHHMTVATRNTRDFEECGIDLVNPFEAE
jgi:predicted nucleic acid-binding protein